MACLDFMKKTFTGGSKTAKFINVFSLESFPLYSNRMVNVQDWKQKFNPCTLCPSLAFAI